MNKRLNISLNIIEFFSILIISILLFEIANITLSGLKEQLLIPVKAMFYITVILELFAITSEMILFIIYNKNIKFIYSIYTVIEVLITILLNIKIPFSGLIIIILFSLVKGVLRILFQYEIYDSKLFKKYCKLFNLKLKVDKNKRKTKKISKVINKSENKKQIKSYA